MYDKWLFDCVEPVLQVGNDIVNMFGTDGQTDGIGFYSLVSQFFLCQLAVGRGSGMDNEAFDVSYIGQQGEYLQVVDELVSLLHAALDLKGENGAAAVGEVLLIQGVVGVLARQR